MEEEENLIEEIEERAIDLGKNMEGSAWALKHDDMVILAVDAIMNELRISNEEKLAALKKAASRYE